MRTHPRLSTYMLCPLLLLMSGGCARGDGAVSGSEGSHSSDSPMSRLGEGPAADVVRRAIAWSGGWEQWESKETVRYTKRITNFGAGEPSATTQIHAYRLHPHPAARIDEATEEGRVALINDMEGGWRVVDGRVDDAPEARMRARNPTFGSHYIFSMPWKLTDRGAELEYVGPTELADGTSAEGVRVRYAPGVGDAGGQHVWTFFFDADGKLVANLRAYGAGPDGYGYTEYDGHREIDGIRMATKRIAYRSNAQAERVERTTEYEYEDVEFGVFLPDSLFEPPMKGGGE